MGVRMVMESAVTGATEQLGVRGWLSKGRKLFIADRIAEADMVVNGHRAIQDTAT